MKIERDDVPVLLLFALVFGVGLTLGWGALIVCPFTLFLSWLVVTSHTEGT